MSGTNSADRILGILNVFTEDRQMWMPEDLMQELGYSRPTLYRYLKSLKTAGLLASLPGGAVMLGPRVVEMDFLAQRSDPLVQFGEPLLDDLAKAFPCSSLLVRWYGDKLLCVTSRCSTISPLSSYPRGRPMPLRRGAISRAILAFLPRRQLEPKIRDNLAEFASIDLGTTVEEVLAKMRETKRAGFAMARGEVTKGVVGIAAPVFSDSAVPIAAVAVTISEQEITNFMLQDIKDKVCAASETLSALLRDEDTQREDIAIPHMNKRASA